MDHRRFDQLARDLAGARSRRSLLKGFGVALAGALAVNAAPAAADNACKPSGPSPQSKCNKNAQCCSQVCFNGNCCTPATRCPTGQNCGTAPDGCGGTVNCGSCTSPETCGGGGTANVCGAACAANGATCTSDGACCSGHCPIGVCVECAANSDCPSGICQGGTCVATVAGTCSAGANYCTAGGDFCGNDACTCAQTTGGNTVCAQYSVCAVCAADADCASVLPGSVCVSAGGVCGCPSATACAVLCPPIASCFTAGTRVAMADGTSRPIAEVAVGDHVLGRDGQVNRVIVVEQPRLANRRLYALNGGEAFVTAEHPFLTEEGWKAIDPAATAAENPSLIVGRLQVGDRLLTLAGVSVLAGARGRGIPEPTAVRLEAVTLERIEVVTADPATPLYNLRLDGDHAYFADDWLVHNK